MFLPSALHPSMPISQVGSQKKPGTIGSFLNSQVPAGAVVVVRVIAGTSEVVLATVVKATVVKASVVEASLVDVV